MITNIISEQNRIRLEITSRRKTEKFTNARKLNNNLLHNHWAM
jgi:hypothetical protein